MHSAKPQKLAKTDVVADKLHSPAVLLLEDDAALAEMLKSFLEMDGFQVSHVVNGVEGLKRILVTSYDLIVCDIAMPAFPGDMFYLAVERIRPDLCRRFIFMTGHTGDSRIIDFVRKSRARLLWKPFRISELLDSMKIIMAEARLTAAKPPQWTIQANLRSGIARPELPRKRKSESEKHPAKTRQ